MSPEPSTISVVINVVQPTSFNNSPTSRNISRRVLRSVTLNPKPGSESTTSLVAPNCSTSILTSESVDHADLLLRFELLEVPAEAQHVGSELRRRLFRRDVDARLTIACRALVQILPAADSLPTSSATCE